MTNLFEAINTKIEKLTYTRKLLYAMTGQENWNPHQLTFDMNKTTLTIDPYSITLISTLFPDIETIKLTLQAKSDPHIFLFENLKAFKNLNKLCLTITDGLTHNSKTFIEIETLKVYFETTCANDTYLKNLLKKIYYVKNLTLCETFISMNTFSTLLTLPIKKLSIKNPHITRSEILNFIRILCNLNLKKLKLIYTQINDIEAEKHMFTAIITYIKNLPHTELQELTITLPNQYEKLNYAQIIYKLKKLTKLNLYMSTNNNYNNVNQIIKLLKIIPQHLETTITYYKNERSKLTHLNDIEFIKQNYPFIKIIEKTNAYVTFPDLIKSENCKNKIATYEKAKAEVTQPKPYKRDNRTIIHNLPNYNQDLQTLNSDIEEIISSDTSNDLGTINVTDCYASDIDSIANEKEKKSNITKSINVDNYDDLPKNLDTTELEFINNMINEDMVDMYNTDDINTTFFEQTYTSNSDFPTIEFTNITVDKNLNTNNSNDVKPISLTELDAIVNESLEIINSSY